MLSCSKVLTFTQFLYILPTTMKVSSWYDHPTRSSGVKEKLSRLLETFFKPLLWKSGFCSILCHDDPTLLWSQSMTDGVPLCVFLIKYAFTAFEIIVMLTNVALASQILSRLYCTVDQNIRVFFSVHNFWPLARAEKQTKAMTEPLSWPLPYMMIWNRNMKVGFITS